MLENLDFQSSGGAVTRNGADVLVAEVVRKGRTIHYVWIDRDHERPFPSSAMNVIKWLQDFKPEGGSPLTVRELSDQPFICPVASNSVLPLLASLHPAPRAGVGSTCEATVARRNQDLYAHNSDIAIALVGREHARASCH